MKSHMCLTLSIDIYLLLINTEIFAILASTPETFYHSCQGCQAKTNKAEKKRGVEVFH